MGQKSIPVSRQLRDSHSSASVYNAIFYVMRPNDRARVLLYAFRNRYKWNPLPIGYSVEKGEGWGEGGVGGQESFSATTAPTLTSTAQRLCDIAPFVQYASGSSVEKRSLLSGSGGFVSSPFAVLLPCSPITIFDLQSSTTAAQRSGAPSR